LTGVSAIRGAGSSRAGSRHSARNRAVKKSVRNRVIHPPARCVLSGVLAHASETKPGRRGWPPEERSSDDDSRNPETASGSSPGSPGGPRDPGNSRRADRQGWRRLHAPRRLGRSRLPRTGHREIATARPASPESIGAGDGWDSGYNPGDPSAPLRRLPSMPVALRDGRNPPGLNGRPPVRRPCPFTRSREPR